MSEPLPHFEIGDEAQVPQEHEPPEQRSFVGITLLAILIGFLVVANLYSYLTRKPSKTTEYSTYHAILKTAAMQVELPKRLQASQPAAAKADDSKALQTLFSKPISELEPLAKKDLEAAAILSVFRDVNSLPVDQSLIDRLEKSKEEKHRLIAEIYGKPPTLKRAEEIEKKLSKTEFAFRWAAAVALERAGDKNAKERALPTSRMYMAGAMTIVAALGFGVGIVLLILYFYMRISGTWLPKGHPMPKLSLFQADQLALRAAQMLAAMYAVQIIVPETLIVVGSIVGSKPNSYVAMAFTTLSAIAVVVSIAAMPFAKGAPNLLKSCIQRNDLGKNILWGVSGALANLPVLIIVTMISRALFVGLPDPEHPTTSLLQTNQNIFLIVVVLIAASIGAPIMEELVFRGAMLPAVVRTMGRPVAGVLVVNLAFAAIHPTGIPAWPALAGIGVVSSILANMRGSLVPSIVMHAVHNLMTLLIAITLF